MLLTSSSSPNPATSFPLPVILLCRRGNKSHALRQQFTEVLERVLPRTNSNGDLVDAGNGDAKAGVKSNFTVRDVAGGLQAWSEQVDPNFPIYWVRELATDKYMNKTRL